MGPTPPRIAAVLVLTYPRDGEPHIIFTRRAETVAAHRGQISLPGGSREATDTGPEHTALREAHEEIGLDATAVTVHGRLEDVYVVVSNFLVTPVVASLSRRPRFLPEPSEVAEIIEVPLALLQDPSIFHEEDRIRNGAQRRIQVYQCGPHTIWGATARVLQLFLDSRFVSLSGGQIKAGELLARKGA